MNNFLPTGVNPSCFPCITCGKWLMFAVVMYASLHCLYCAEVASFKIWTIKKANKSFECECQIKVKILGSLASCCTLLSWYASLMKCGYVAQCLKCLKLGNATDFALQFSRLPFTSSSGTCNVSCCDSGSPEHAPVNASYIGSRNRELEWFLMKSYMETLSFYGKSTGGEDHMLHGRGCPGRMLVWGIPVPLLEWSLGDLLSSPFSILLV